MKLKYYTVTCALLLQFVVYSQEESPGAIVTDRPDQTESALVVPKSYFQIETGSLVALEGGFVNWTINSTLFRYGVAKNLEIRLVTGLERLRFNGWYGNVVNVGITDIQAGLKYQFLNATNFQMAVLSHVVIPSSEFSTDPVWNNLLLFSHPVCNRVSFSYNVGLSMDFENNDLYLLYTFSSGFVLTDQVGFFFELFGASDLDDGNLIFDSGFTYRLKDNLQFDFSFGTGVTDKYNFWSGGLSWRLPN